MQTLTLISISAASFLEVPSQEENENNNNNKKQNAAGVSLPTSPKAAEESKSLRARPTPDSFYFRSTFKFLIWIDYGGVGVAAAEIMNALGEGELKHY